MIDSTYAGIGSRRTPPDVCESMALLASQLAINGWRLATGGAMGADCAFMRGAPKNMQMIYLPWYAYNRLRGPQTRVLSTGQLISCIGVAQLHHPAWHQCSTTTRKLHARNVAILFGCNLDRPVRAVIAYTKNGAVTGGTGMGLRLAAAYDIPVFNFGVMGFHEILDALSNISQDKPKCPANEFGKGPSY